MYALYSCILDFTDLGFPRSSDIFTIDGIPGVRTCMCLPINYWIINGRGLGVGGSGGQGVRGELRCLMTNLRMLILCVAYLDVCCF